MNRQVLTYQKCAELIRGGRSKVEEYRGKKLEKNTYLYFDGHAFHVRFHQTDVVTILPQNEWILRSGGWHTKTTKERLNTYGPVQIHQTSWGWWFVAGEKRFDFVEGMRISKEILFEELL